MAEDPDQARDLARRALELIGDEQDDFLDTSCGEDSDLRAEVEALLAARDQAQTGTLPTERLPTDQAPLELELGQQIGPYKVLELLGEGGYGTVYLAEQKEPVKRRVALKVIKLGMDTRQVIARFEAERQALAMMAHSNIARVLDVGATESGRPYFVMELVRGVPITDYCEKQHLGLRERLELYVPVCHALQHAHQKGVIHRDVKPSNVLVTVESGRPVPKVIDFGIAKATLQDLTDKTLVTFQQQLIGTPTYMPPEQAELTGLDVDTRADIYALGVLLYELLTGATPFDRKTLHDSGRVEMLRIIREVEPPRPSMRVEKTGEGDRTERLRPPELDLGKQLHGDLDWIVMKCLEKDRTRRYETASELAAEIGRHLEHQPVLAGPPSASYRMRKFVMRNRGAVVAGAVGLSLLLVGVIATTWGLLWALEEQARADVLATSEKAARIEAQGHADAAEAAAELALASRLLAEQETLRAEDALAESEQRALELERVSGLQAAQLGDVDPQALGLRIRDLFFEEFAERSRWDGQSPEQIEASSADLRERLRGVNFTNLALETLVEGVLDPTLQAVREEFPDQPLVRARMEQVLATLYRTLGLHDRAKGPQQTALDTRLAELGPDDPLSLQSLEELGHLMGEDDRLAQALEVLKQCRDARLAALGAEHRDTLATEWAIANVMRELGDAEEALELHLRVLDDRLRLFGEADIDSLRSLADVGTTLFDLRRFSEALEYDERALEGRRALLGIEDPETLASLNNVGVALRDLSEHRRALELLTEAHEAARRLYGDRHGATLATSLNVGSVLRKMGLYSEAEAHYEHVLSVHRELHGDSSLDTLLAFQMLGTLRYHQTRREEAIELLGTAWRGMRRQLGDAHFDVLLTASTYGQVLLRDGRFLDAERLLVETAHSARQGLGPEHGSTADALADVEQLLPGLQGHFGTLEGPSDLTLACVNAVVAALNVTGAFEDGEALATMGLSMHEPAEAGVSPWLLAETRSLLGESRAGQGQASEAEQLLLEGFRLMESRLPVDADHTGLARAARRLVRFYEDQKRAGSAATWRRRARELDGTGS
jgi:non-specific serine/threonine protein kinase/serine/threonine-protein kinase